jgi:hypothetical protein
MKQQKYFLNEVDAKREQRLSKRRAEYNKNKFETPEIIKQ